MYIHLLEWKMSRLSVLKPPYTAFNTLLKIESIYGDFALQTAFSTLGDNEKKNIQGVPNTCDWKKKINISHFESSYT